MNFKDKLFQSIQTSIEEFIKDYNNEISTKFNIDKDELSNIFSNISCSSSSSHVVSSPKKPDKTLDMSSLQSCNVAELKALCKERGLKCGGKKTEILSRLVEFSKTNGDNTGTGSRNEQDIPKKPQKQMKPQDTLKKEVIKKLQTTIGSQVPVRRNAFGNYQHSQSNLIFNNQKKVYAVQNEDGTVDPLNEESIEICRKFNFPFVMPDNLASKKDNETEIQLSDDEELSDDDEELSDYSREEQKDKNKLPKKIVKQTHEEEDEESEEESEEESDDDLEEDDLLEDEEELTEDDE